MPVGVIAIDGPGGSGKSTVARAVAERLGADRLDTGSMYRAVAWVVVTRGVEPADAARLPFEVGEVVAIDGEDVTAAIRTPDVTSRVSEVAARPEVRAALVEHQRRWAEGRRLVVVEGRDIGTVVFPDAVLKVFLTASKEERGRRRAAEQGRPDSEAVAADLARRDRLDATRAVSPLTKAEDAVEVDTTGLTVDQVVDRICDLLRAVDAETGVS